MGFELFTKHEDGTTIRVRHETTTGNVDEHVVFTFYLNIVSQVNHFNGIKIPLHNTVKILLLIYTISILDNFKNHHNKKLH